MTIFRVKNKIEEILLKYTGKTARILCHQIHTMHILHTIHFPVPCSYSVRQFYTGRATEELSYSADRQLSLNYYNPVHVLWCNVYVSTWKVFMPFRRRHFSAMKNARRKCLFTTLWWARNATQGHSICFAFYSANWHLNDDKDICDDSLLILCPLNG